MLKYLAITLLTLVLTACSYQTVNEKPEYYHLDGTYHADLSVVTVNDGPDGTSWIDDYGNIIIGADQMGTSSVFDGFVGTAEDDGVYFGSDRLYDIYLDVTDPFYIQLYITGKATRDSAEIVLDAQWFDVATDLPLTNHVRHILLYSHLVRFAR